jgi:hypothetical protein
LLAALAQAHGAGVAVLHSDGSVAAEDSQFESLRQAEWRAGPDAQLPAHAYATLLERGNFAGRTLRLHLWRQEGFSACAAELRTSCDLLTRAERVVAFRYANGDAAPDCHLSRRARRVSELGRSPYSAPEIRVSVLASTPPEQAKSDAGVGN